MRSHLYHLEAKLPLTQQVFTQTWIKSSLTKIVWTGMIDAQQTKQTISISAGKQIMASPIRRFRVRPGTSQHRLTQTLKMSR
jgi:hypothetical protein